MPTITEMISRRDALNDQIAAASIGQDVESLVLSRDWYNRNIDQCVDDAKREEADRG
jgi:hypothetical protein